jgi:hypothetical protein
MNIKRMRWEILQRHDIHMKSEKNTPIPSEIVGTGSKLKDQNNYNFGRYVCFVHTYLKTV